MIVFSLVGLLIFQQLFWAIVCHRLVNKLMSRSYFEYQQAEQAFTPKPIKLSEPEADEDLGALDGLGGF